MIGGREGGGGRGKTINTFNPGWSVILTFILFLKM